MRINRRRFLQAAGAIAAVPLAATGYGLLEARMYHVTRHRITVPNLPPGFVGKTVALLTDPHLGPHNSPEFIDAAVETMRGLHPDMVAISGDFVSKGTDRIREAVRAFADLCPPLGVFAVPGNHDMTEKGRPLRRAFAEFGLNDVTNGGRWVESGPDRLRIAGVDDLWWGKPDLEPGLRGVSAADACILLSHNPDFAETLTDPRVGLVLSGHTHGGQILIPGMEASWIPSKYGRKYLAGLVRAPHTQVFVSRGLGCVAVPMRVGSQPEINLLTLTA